MTDIIHTMFGVTMGILLAEIIMEYFFGDDE